MLRKWDFWGWLMAVTVAVVELSRLGFERDVIVLMVAGWLGGWFAAGLVGR